MTPVPLVNMPVRVAGLPAVTAVGLAAKLVMTGTGGPAKKEFEQPVRAAKGRVMASTQRAWAVVRFIRIS
jgi:hypothetical protein